MSTSPIVTDLARRHARMATTFFQQGIPVETAWERIASRAHTLGPSRFYELKDHCDLNVICITTANAHDDPLLSSVQAADFARRIQHVHKTHKLPLAELVLRLARAQELNLRQTAQVARACGIELPTPHARD